MAATILDAPHRAGGWGHAADTRHYVTYAPIETVKKMVERGIGLSFLPLLAVARDIRRGRLLALDVTGREPLRRSLDVIHPRNRPLSAEAQARTLRAGVSRVAVPTRRR
ncbi:MAG: hypothetical protein HY294_02345 [Candidatus Rokubacteria bacterium]|nr:hypothetical protein [Candidatus Rokubacteria bacterium]